jgi:uncharacterized OB-fold protein
MPDTDTAGFLPVEDLDGQPRFVDPSIVTLVDGSWRLLGTRCRACDSRFFPRAYSCAACLGDDLEPFPLSTAGEVQVSALAAATQPGFVAPARYAWVNLPADGVRVFTHLIPVDGAEPPPGTPARFCPVVVGGDDGGPFCAIAFRTSIYPEKDRR